MKQQNKYTCVIVGDESLLIQCSEIIIRNGHKITAISSSNPAIIEWANDKKIPIFRTIGALCSQLTTPFDYLFSIANLALLPFSLIQKSQKKSINYHDGPLPRYSGLNTPSWAIINGEKEYGISWHIMAEKVDTGGILKQVTFNIDEKETALTLNAKCYDAAISSFEELLTELEQGTETVTPQDLSKRSLYRRNQRPKAASVIDWNEDAEKIDALVRSLDFGNYRNIMGSPKLILDKEIYIISETTISTTNTKAEKPGTIVDIDKNHITIATQSKALTIAQLTSLTGKPISPEKVIKKHQLTPGSKISSLSKEEIDSLTNHYQSIFTKEEFWEKRLQNIDPIELNIDLEPKNGGNNEFNFREFNINPALNIDHKTDRDTTLALFSLFLSRIGRKSEFDIAYHHSALPQLPKRTKGIFSEYIPLHIQVSENDSLAEYMSKTQDTINSTTQQEGYALDIVTRYPKLRSPAHPWHEQPPNILVYLTPTLNEITRDKTKGICKADLALAISNNGRDCLWSYNQSVYNSKEISRLESQFLSFASNCKDNETAPIQSIPLLDASELERLCSRWHGAITPDIDTKCIHQLIEASAQRTPNSEAIICHEQSLSFKELNEKANQIAHYLIDQNIGPGDFVGVLLDRSINLVPAMIGIWKAGAAYIPLDPSYPKDRLAYMAEDSKLSFAITQKEYINYLPNIDTLTLDKHANTVRNHRIDNPVTAVKPSDLAYIIYTSGSTGKPKGVMVEHRNVVNFFSGMDRVIGPKKPGTWLAVTSISFDISVLELFWTLSRNFKIIIYTGADQADENCHLTSKHPDIPMDFSLFYWNIVTDQNRNDEDKYRLLMESAKYGDENNFSAIWTPERHFGSFGGMFPNPSVISAAIAVQTKRIGIRSGSCVLPLHSPIRAAEEWAVVDNLSNGRVGLGIASGWQPNDFVIKPENHTRAKEIMFESIEQLKQLWRGEKVTFPGPDGQNVEVQTLPRPIQAEPPIWITVAGNPETYKQAGRIGANILTHLLGQDVDQVEQNIALYRQEREAAGHQGDGHVTLLLHTLVGSNEEEVKALSRQPMKDYLLSAVFLVKAAAWHFPTFKDLSEETGKTLDEYFASISDDDLDAVLDFAFERYYNFSGLFGTPERCMKMVDRLKEIGVNEIGCLIDYGLATDTALEHLPYLNSLREASNRAPELKDNDFSIPALIRRHKVTHFQCTPSMANMLMADELAHSALKMLDYIMVGGEAFPSKLAKELNALTKGQVINMYGPTETTIWSATHEIKTDEAPVPIGTPITNTQIYIVDKYNHPLPAGIAGELVIGGQGVVRGYLHRKELTNERFIPNPIESHLSEKIYRTGDLARYRQDGVLEFMGRLDHQIKIRGYRVELGELESILEELPQIKQAVTIVREETEGDQRLIAYYTTEQQPTPSTADLSSHMQQHLPEFMVPSLFIHLDEFPLTPNGKIDRNALAKIETDHTPLTPNVTSPKNDTERVISNIWKEVLGIEEISCEQNFFQAGGHSLLAAQVIARIRKLFNTTLPLRSIFEAPTITLLAQRLINEHSSNSDAEKLAKEIIRAGGTSPIQASAKGIEKCPEDLLPPLSYAQQRMWFLDKIEPGSHYNDTYSATIEGTIDIDLLQRCINEVIDRHELLRTGFKQKDGQPFQDIQQNITAPLNLILSADMQEEQLQQAITQEIQRPFDLSTPPLFRITIYQRSNQHYIFLLVIHQVANDSWSTGVLTNEIWSLYKAYSAGQPTPLHALPIQYADFSVWQRQQLEEGGADKELEYWKSKLSGHLPTLDLPTDHPRPAQQTFSGAKHFFTLPDNLTRQLRSLAQQESITLFNLFTAAFKTLLHRYTGESDIIIGAPFANRDHEDLEPLIGMLINNLVLRTDISGNPTFLELLHRVRTTTTEAYDNPNVPFERLVEILQPERDLSRTPLFQVMIDYQNTPTSLPDLEPIKITPFNVDGKSARFDLTLELTESNKTIKGHFEYNTQLFSADRISRFETHLLTLLTEIAAHPDKRLSQLTILSTGEQQLLSNWNRTKSDYPKDLLINQLITQQANTHPASQALVYQDEITTYQELERRANQLAHALHKQGVKENALIGICMDRHSDMVVAMLGILKTGAAYVPLDPGYPDERIEYVVKDSGLSYAIVDPDQATKLSPHKVKTITIDDIDNQSTEIFKSSITSKDLAYIIYTSGSTGRPKGVKVSHRNVVNFLTSMTKEPGISHQDRLLAVTTISFDISILEIFLPLINGATVLLADRQTSIDGKSLKQLIETQHATIMQATPTTWRLLLAADWQGGENFKALCGGEPMPAELAQQLVRAAGAGLWNMYGPTETTVWSTCEKIREDTLKINIGRPIDNTEIYILDATLNPVPIGVNGELYIGGEGVSSGYHNRDELTKERFIQNPFDNTHDNRLYRTGDIARYADDGTIECLGRLDNQIKLRGYRIELGEIETILTAHPAIKQAVVGIKEAQIGDKRLVAYVTYEKNHPVTVSELRKYLRTTLPDYMTPSLYQEVQAFPLTPNGKIDRKSLPNPFHQNTVTDEYTHPNTQEEHFIAQVWKDALQLERISIHDNFFDLGGHSLLSMQVIARIEKETGCQISPRAMIMDTLAQIAPSLVLTQKETITPSPTGETNTTTTESGQHISGIFGKIRRILSSRS